MVVIKESQEAVDRWNDCYSIGQRVAVTRDTGEITYTRTRSEAFVAQSGHAVIHVEAISGYYSLDRVKEGYLKAKADDVWDTIITDYCENCIERDDYHCPDHNCPAWKAISLLAEISVGVTN